MGLREHFESSGAWCFRHRSLLPLLLLAAIAPALIIFEYPDGSHGQDLLWETLCLGLSLFGIAIRAAVVGYALDGTSGRNTREHVAKALNTNGLYSVVRHPLYLGNYFMWLGISLLPRVWWCPVVISLVFWLYYERIMFAEEEFLRTRFGAAWLEWAARTPAFVPALQRWRPPDVPFSLRMVLKREYSGLFGLVTVFTLLEAIGDWAREGRLEVDPVWAWLFAIAAVLHILFRTLKRRTKLLHIEGR